MSELSAELAAEDDSVRLAAIVKIARRPQTALSEPALAALIRCLGSRQKLIQRRAADALAGAAKHDNHVVAMLSQSLDSTEPRLRWGVAYALGMIPGGLDLRALSALLEALASPDGDVRWAAAELVVKLGQSHPTEVRSSLVALHDSSNANARKMALYCLRDLRHGGKEIQALLKRAILSDDSHVRLAALSLLGRLGEATAESGAMAMHLLRSDPHRGVRRAAANALGRLQFRSPEVRDALEEAAHDRADGSLRRAARQALVQLDGN